MAQEYLVEVAQQEPVTPQAAVEAYRIVEAEDHGTAAEIVAQDINPAALPVVLTTHKLVAGAEDYAVAVKPVVTPIAVTVEITDGAGE